MLAYRYAAAALSAALCCCTPSNGPSSQQIDELTLAYLKGGVFPHGSVICNGARVGTRDYIGCKNTTLDGNSAMQIWVISTEQSAPRYLALNGTAIQTYENHLATFEDLGVVKTPLPPDLSIDDAVKALR